MPPIDQPRVSAWVRQVAERYGKKVGDINFIFVSDEEILRINREYIQHDYYTDHIGFDYSSGNVLSGDVFIGVETVASNAELIGETYIASSSMVCFTCVASRTRRPSCTCRWRQPRMQHWHWQCGCSYI